MMKRMLLVLMLIMATVAVGALPSAVSAAPGRQRQESGERAELKERFKQRFPTLVALKRAEKVGETYRGLAAAVKKEHLDQPADAKGGGGQTVREFLEAENADRKRLYQLIAEETGAGPEAVARRDAQRRFNQAKPHELLQPEEGRWVRKREM